MDLMLQIQRHKCHNRSPSNPGVSEVLLYWSLIEIQGDSDLIEKPFESFFRSHPTDPTHRTAPNQLNGMHFDLLLLIVIMTRTVFHLVFLLDLILRHSVRHPPMADCHGATFMMMIFCDDHHDGLRHSAIFMQFCIDCSPTDAKKLRFQCKPTLVEHQQITLVNSSS